MEYWYGKLHIDEKLNGPLGLFETNKAERLCIHFSQTAFGMLDIHSDVLFIQNNNLTEVIDLTTERVLIKISIPAKYMSYGHVLGHHNQDSPDRHFNFVA